MENLAARVRELIVASDSYRQTMAAAVDLSTVETAMLDQLLHDGPQTPSMIAARVGLTPAAVTSMIDRVEAAGYVGRASHPSDRRSLLVGLTDQGRAAVEAQFRMFSTDVLAALAGSSDPRLREQPALRSVVTELLADMAAALRTRAGDAAGVRATVRIEMSAINQPADDDHP